MPTQEGTHACPIPGCRYHSLPYGLLMCPDHWRLVPRALQKQVYAAWNKGRPTVDYIHVRKDAIKAVTAAQGAT
jgi:hypothetical protein